MDTQGIQIHTRFRIAQLMETFTMNELLDLERGALNRWGQGDPTGILELYAPDITYFDPLTAARIDGYDAMKQCAEAARKSVGTFTLGRR
jgi:hypothetical protein